MNSVIDLLFGHDKDLTVLQMSFRAIVMFFITLFILRISGVRSFGSGSALDNIVVIMLGAVLSRAIVGASPFFATVIAGTVLALLHKAISVASLYSDGLSDLVKGTHTSLYKNGKVNYKNLKKVGITHGDLLEGVRLQANMDSLDKVEEIFMERSGELSVIKKDE